MDTIAEQIQRIRMHGLYLSRKCQDITQLSRDLMGLHCWFHRNVAFSAVIRGADLMNWKHALTKTWLYRGTLHGVAYDDLPLLLAPHAGDGPAHGVQTRSDPEIRHLPSYDCCQRTGSGNLEPQKRQAHGGVFQLPA